MVQVVPLALLIVQLPFKTQGIQTATQQGTDTLISTAVASAPTLPLTSVHAAHPQHDLGMTMQLLEAPL
jgi:hypothetical protein